MCAPSAWVTPLLISVMLVGLPKRCEAEGGDPGGERNLAATSELPQGRGLAASLPPGSPISEHPDVIFAEDFESDDYLSHWDDVRNDRGEVLSLVRLEPSTISPGAAASHGQSLKVTATLGRNTGGGMTKWFESTDRLFIRFYVRFDHDCDYVHHFCTLRANKAIRGGDAWSGFGGAGICPEGTERFSTALEPWGDWGRLPPPGKWNFYSYWHEMSASPDGKYWGNAFRPADQEPIPKDRWICCEMMLDHNSPGQNDEGQDREGQRDGGQAFWIDGKLMGQWSGIHWRKTNQLWANAFTLESYVTDRWTRQKTNIVYFDDVVIARSYIGPK